MWGFIKGNHFTQEVSAWCLPPASQQQLSVLRDPQEALWFPSHLWLATRLAQENEFSKSEERATCGSRMIDVNTGINSLGIEDPSVVTLGSGGGRGFWAPPIGWCRGWRSFLCTVGKRPLACQPWQAFGQPQLPVKSQQPSDPQLVLFLHSHPLWSTNFLSWKSASSLACSGSACKKIRSFLVEWKKRDTCYQLEARGCARPVECNRHEAEFVNEWMNEWRTHPTAIKDGKKTGSLLSSFSISLIISQPCQLSFPNFQVAESFYQPFKKCL